MKNPFKEIVLRDNIFHRELHILIGGTAEKLADFAFKNLDTELEITNTSDGCHFCVEKNNYFYYFIWLQEFNWTPHSISVLSHEITHFTFSSFKDLRIPTDKKTDECFAYFHQSYLQRALEKLKK